MRVLVLVLWCVFAVLCCVALLVVCRLVSVVLLLVVVVCWIVIVVLLVVLLSSMTCLLRGEQQEALTSKAVPQKKISVTAHNLLRWGSYFRFQF